MSAPTTCPRCGATHPASVAGGMCPGCLLAGLLETPADARLGEREGDAVGPYELVERLGEGGMGSVWRARQLHPVEREVALKIIRLGMDTREIVSRFEAERQSLAMMDHPGIARVYEAGATESGRPYFAMELVAGEPVTEYCVSRSLAVEERLRIFLEICGAVEHAHRKGVLHRDLKPSNVLVVEGVGGPRVKVIDFGIAKLLDEEIDGRTFATRAGHAIGTPGYMSPEQAGAAPDVDTRSDVYSLGALLYEMLTGAPPLGRETFREVAHAEVMRLIRETDPPRPSTRVVRAGKAGEVAPLRIGRDLDRIVMKALSRERERRYGGATLLGEDVRRFLDHEPVSATDPTLGYRAGKFVRKHRVPVGFSVLLVVALLVATLLVAREAGRARQAAQGERRARVDILGNLADAYRNAGFSAAREHDHALAALYFTQASEVAGHDPERSRANRLRANLHALEAPLPVRVLASPEANYLPLAFDESGRFLHEGGHGRPDAIFDLESGAAVEPGFELQVACLLPGGSLAAMSDGGARVEVRDLMTMEVVESFELPDGAVERLACDASGDLIAAGDARLWIWDRREERFTGGPREHPRALRHVGFAPGGERVLTIDLDFDLRVFPTVGESPEPSFPPIRVEGATTWARMLPHFHDGSDRIRLVREGALEVIDVRDGRTLERSAGLARAYDFSGDGELYIDDDGLRDSTSRAPCFERRIGGGVFVPGGSAIYTGYRGEFYDLEGRLLGRTNLRGAEPAFSRDGSLLALRQCGMLTIHQRARPVPYRRLAARGAGRLTLSSDEMLFASAGWSGGGFVESTTRAFRVCDGQPAGPEIDTGTTHFTAAFLPGSTRLVTAGRVAGGGGSLQLWEALEGVRLGTPLSIPAVPLVLDCHPTAGWIALLCDDGRVLRIEPDLGGLEEIVRLDFGEASPGFDGRISPGALKFSDDGTRLYATGLGRAAEVWAIDWERKRVEFRTSGRTGDPSMLAVRDGVLVSPTTFVGSPWLMKAADGEALPLSEELKPEKVIGWSISPDGKRLLLSGSHRVETIALPSRSRLGPAYRPGTDSLSASVAVPGTPWCLTAATSTVGDAWVVLWDQRTGLEVGPRWQLGSVALGEFVVTGDGERAILALRDRGYVIIHLDEIRAAQEWHDDLGPADRVRLAELCAGRRWLDGRAVPLEDPYAWQPLWEDFLDRHPQPFPLRPEPAALIRWHLNQEALQGPESRAGKWHRGWVGELREEK